MRYVEFRDAIDHALRVVPEGMTWAQLRESLALPYDVPCPEWTRRLEGEIGLSRTRGAGRALVWRVSAAAARSRGGRVRTPA